MYSAQEIAFVIKQTAKSKNLTIKQLLENCELSINTISELSKGKQISYISFSKIADYLDCSVDYLLGRTDNPNISTESYIGGDNNGVQAIKNNGAVMINQSSKAEQQDEMTKELIKAFQSMSFTDKMEIMNAVLEKTKK